jgi:hypothetical protein
LNAFAGSTLRGGFGHAFKRAVCIWPPGDCQRCLLRNTCSYLYIFETAPPPGSEKLRGIDQIPRPFVIEPPDGPQRVFDSGEHFSFRLVLVGRAIDYLPYFVFTFSQLGQTGLGPGRGQFEIVEVHSEGRLAQPCRASKRLLVASRLGYRRWVHLPIRRIGSHRFSTCPDEEGIETPHRSRG